MSSGAELGPENFDQLLDCHLSGETVVEQTTKIVPLTLFFKKNNRNGNNVLSALSTYSMRHSNTFAPIGGAHSGVV